SLAVALTVSSVTAASLALFAAVRLGPEGRRAKRVANQKTEDAIAFLFDRTELVDATQAGERLIAAAPNDQTEWGRLMALLGPQFPELIDGIDTLAQDGKQSYVSQDNSTKLRAEWRDGLCRLSLVDQDLERPTTAIDSQSHAALERELETLRANTDNAPYIVWRQDDGGRITWFNRSYLKALQQVRGPDAAKHWPTPPLFDTLSVAEVEEETAPLRVALELANTEAWYDIHVARDAGELVCTAIDIGRVVDAERQLKAFTQTLTKTFADLAAGLAIFDRSRRLVLFNPALADLTELPFDFLAGHPTLFGLLDRMRDQGRVPEPRNYTEWRRQIAELEISAEGGFFSETWTLPNGQTIRVTGRPHPDGALAFIFEDISAEISLTRRFRAELDAGRAVLDHFDEAVAVFSGAGILTMANSAYAKLWGDNPMSGIDQIDIADLAKLWSARSLPSPAWERASAFVRTAGAREAWSAEVTLRDGRAVTCRLVPLSGGSTLVGFTTRLAGSSSVQFRRRAS
ncbi:MAG: PAS-domain containing protein, partial [Pseudomonadota bacterium]